jgi:hypothetical protein
MANTAADCAAMLAASGRAKQALAIGTSCAMILTTGG